VLWLAPRLRPEDKREIETVSGRDSSESLSLSVSTSLDSYTFRFPGERKPFAIFGVAHDDKNAGYGAVWFLATPDVARARVAVLREVPFWLNSWSRWYPHGLHNIVDSRNTLHLRWLEALDFQLGPVTLVNGVPFIYAIRYKE
jgi:hypothetical protein